MFGYRQLTFYHSWKIRHRLPYKHGYAKEPINPYTIYFVSDSQKSKDHVFFYAMMPAADITLNKNSIVKFSEVSNNEGNHFNSGDSVFVSPVSGVYLFSWTTTTTSSKTTNTELRVNNVRIETLHSAVGGTGAISVTKVIITNVKKNDHAWIQTSGFYTDNYFDYNYNSRSSFMGFLMYET